MTCRILAPQPKIEPGPSAVEVWRPNHWRTRESPALDFLSTCFSGASSPWISYLLSDLWLSAFPVSSSAQTLLTLWVSWCSDLGPLVPLIPCSPVHPLDVGPAAWARGSPSLPVFSPSPSPRQPPPDCSSDNVTTASPANFELSPQLPRYILSTHSHAAVHMIFFKSQKYHTIPLLKLLMAVHCFKDNFQISQCGWPA